MILKIKILQRKMKNKDCLNREKNLGNCPCDCPGCEKKGMCRECVIYHKKAGGLPACLR